MKIRLTIALLAAALTVGTEASARAGRPAAPRQDPAELAFLTAWDAFREGDPIKLGRVAPRAKGHVLEPYVEQWRLRLKLDETRPGEIQDFLSRHDGSLLAEQVRSEWLKLLGRKGHWELFRAERPLLVNTDAEVLCFDLIERSRSGDAAVPADLKPAWLSPQELPPGCSALAGQLLQTGRYGSREVWQRFRVLAEANRIPAAKKLLESLPPRDVPGSRSIDNALAAPVRHLLQLPDGVKTRAGKELAILALSRIAKNDPQAAADRFTESLREELTAEDQGYVWGRIASTAARRHMPEALQWFIEAGDAELTDEQRAWQLRIALRTGNWSQALAAADRMSPRARAESTWTYWRARALAAHGRADEATPLFRRIAGEFSFYGRLAAEELGQPFVLPSSPAPLADAEVAQVMAAPGIQRSLALFGLDMRTEAVREWNWTVRNMEDRQLIIAADIARRNKIWDRAINTADRTVAQHDFSLRFLAPHKDVFASHARAQSLEEHYVLGLVRQESRFISWARSTAGASGLMQLMPATARWVARKMGMKDFSWSKVNTIDVNAALGTYYLRQVLDDLNGHAILATAAYNAGPGRARRWLGNAPMEGAIYIESIPFNETRDYVKKVMINTLYYAAVHGGNPGSLKSRIGTVGQRAALAAIDTP